MSSPPRRTLRRVLLAGGILFLVVVLAVGLLRRPLVAAAISSGLRMAGAGDVSFDVTTATPWTVEVENLGFSLKTQRFDLRRVTMERASWWRPTLGAVRVEGLRVPLTLDGSDTNPWAWSTYSGSGGGGSLTLPLPADEVSVDGVLVVQVGGQPAQELAVKFDARLGSGQRWQGKVAASAPGLAMQATGEFDAATKALTFDVSRAELDLARWQGFIQRLVVLPGGAWDLAGQLTGTGRGTYANEKLTAQGQVQLRAGRFAYPERNVVAEGVTADFTFRDFTEVISEPGTLRVETLRAGEIVARELDFALAFEGSEKIAVSRARLRAFGGQLAAEPFTFRPGSNELEATLLIDGLVVEELLALAKDVPAKATGLVDGRVPLRIDNAGLRFGTGYLELKKGAYAEVQFNARGLLTRGVPPNHASYPTLQKVESGLLRLKLSQLRLDIRPPNAPAGRTATIRLAGEPVDPEVKAPVSLDLNVNGPLEQLLNLGMDNRIRFGGNR